MITIGIPFGLALLPTGLGSPIWSAALAFLLLWLIAGIVAGRLADQIPPALTTVGSIVPYVGISNPEEWSHEYVLQRVLQITSLQLGIPVEKIHPDHHFVEDLGLD